MNFQRKHSRIDLKKMPDSNSNITTTDVEKGGEPVDNQVTMDKSQESNGTTWQCRLQNQDTKSACDIITT